MSSDIQRFLEEVNKELKFDEYRVRFVEELQDHIDDEVRERELQGIKAESAYRESLIQLGEVKKLASFYNFVVMKLKKPFIFIPYSISLGVGVASVALLLSAIVGGYI